MSNNNVKKYTVEEFCEKYNKTNIEQTKEALIKKAMNSHYIPYEKKIAICEKIIENSYYKKVKTIEKDGVEVKKLYVNSPASYMLYCLYLIKEYTNIEVDFSNVLKDFNMLNESELFDIIINNISERELKEFRMILDMVESDVLQNEYGAHAFISNQVERFGELFGIIVNPALQRLSDVLENMDEKTIDKIMNKLNGLKGKFGVK